MSTESDGKLEDCCKFGRVSSEYGLREFATDYAEREWQKRDGTRLRSLEAEFHRQLVTKVFEEELRGLHSFLETDEIVTAISSPEEYPGRHERIRQRLVDRDTTIDDLRSDFLSYKTIGRHLRQCRGLSKPQSDSDPLQRAAQTIGSFRGRLRAVAMKTLNELDSAGRVAFEPANLRVSVTATCASCGTQVTLDRVLDVGRCPHCRNE